MNTFEIKEHIGVAFVRPSGMQMELNIIEWNDSKNDVIDIRNWTADHLNFSRGLELSKSEMERLVAAYEKEIAETSIKTEDVKDEVMFTIGDEPFTVNINRILDTLSEKATGWTRKFTVSTWAGCGKPKFDIRLWSPDCERMSRGLTLTDSEMESIISVYKAKYPKGGGAQA